MFNVNWINESGEARSVTLADFAEANFYAMILVETFDAEFITIEAI